MKAEDCLERVKDLIVEQTGWQRDKIKSESRLSDDCGIDGLDAMEFMSEFVKRFSIDPSGFEFHEYFCDEGSDPFSLLHGCLFGRKTKPLTVSYLVNVAIHKKWMWEAIDPKNP